MLLEDSVIGKICQESGDADLKENEDLSYLLGKWKGVSSALSVTPDSYSAESAGILKEYASLSSGPLYDYRKDPWYGFSGGISGKREENAFSIYLLDTEDMVHDLMLLSEDMPDSLSYANVREALALKNALSLYLSPENLSGAPNGEAGISSIECAFREDAEKLLVTLSSLFMPDDGFLLRLRENLSVIFERYLDSALRLFSFWDPAVRDMFSFPLEKLGETVRRAGEEMPPEYEWKKYRSVLAEASSHGIITFIDGLLERGAQKSDVIPCYQKALVRKALSLIFLPDEAESTEEKEEMECTPLFPPYVEVNIRQEAAELAVDSFTSENFPRLISSVVSTEAPLFERDLIRRLSFLGGEEGITREIVSSYEKAVAAIDGSGIIRRGGFIYRPGDNGISFRTSSSMRDFSHIAPEELEDGMLKILERLSPVGKSVLYGTLGSYCGYTTVLSSRYGELDSILSRLGSRVRIRGEIIAIGGKNVPEE